MTTRHSESWTYRFRAPLLVADHRLTAEPTVFILSPERLGRTHDARRGCAQRRLCRVAMAPQPVGRVDPDYRPEAGAELPDGEIGEFRLVQGDNVAQGY